jgi:hypothetical protein
VTSADDPRVRLQVGEDALVFMHLPKTGGTSMRSALCGVYAPDEIALVYPSSGLLGAMTRAEFASLPDDVRDRTRFVMGHFPFGIHHQLARPSRYVTLLRDPVERAISLYYHFRNIPGIRFGSKGHRERLRMRLTRVSLEEWVFSGRRQALDNLMVRNISGRMGVPFGQCTETMLEQALEHVESDFAALLVTERLAASTALLEQAIERPIPPLPHVNANPNRPPARDIDTRVRERIRELNHLDVRLHEIALERLDSSQR